MKRLVETDRWKDAWFVELTPYSKLLLSYLYDNCDEAGFIDVQYPLWQTQLKMTKEQIFASIKFLQPALLSDKKSKLFVIDFLKHQKKLPLIKGQEEADWIIAKLKSNLGKFNDAPAIINILENHIEVPGGKKIASSKKKLFTPPTFEELKAYYLEEEPKAELDAIKDIYDHYVGCGWVVGKNKPMVDWHAAVRRAIRNQKTGRFSHNRNGGGEQQKSNRTATTLGVVQELKKGG